MNKKDLKVIEEALRKRPNNIALRLTYALKLFKIKEFDQCETNFEYVLKLDPKNVKAKQGLVELFFAKENYSAVIVIAEELNKINVASEKMLELFAKSLLRQNSIVEAQEIYDRILDNNPFYYDEELDSVLEDADEYLEDDPFFDDDGEFEEGDMDDIFENPFFGDDTYMFLPESSITYSNIVGLDRAKDLFRFKMPILQEGMPHKGSNKVNVLLYGPYGCGKTHLIRSLPYELDTKILPFGLDRITEIYNYQAEGLLHYYFGKMRLNQPCILFIDEVEKYAFDRNQTLSKADHIVVSKLLEELDGVRFIDDPQFVVGATNMPWKMDLAFFRSGRFDYQEFIPPPSKEDRLVIIHKLIKKGTLSNNQLEEIASLTPLWNYSELLHLFDKIDFEIFRAGSKGILKNELFDKVVDTIKTINPIARDWFKLFMESMPDSHKNTAMYKKVEMYLAGLE